MMATAAPAFEADRGAASLAWDAPSLRAHAEPGHALEDSMLAPGRDWSMVAAAYEP